MRLTMKILFLISLSYFFIISCDTVEQSNNNIEGVYKGTYSITHNMFANNTYSLNGTITFQFTKNMYKCEGEKQWLPPSGIGRYYYNPGFITLTDTIGHSADFDWTLILNGKFFIIINNGGHLLLIQYDMEHKRKHEIELYRQK